MKRVPVAFACAMAVGSWCGGCTVAGQTVADKKRGAMERTQAHESKVAALKATVQGELENRERSLRREDKESQKAAAAVVDAAIALDDAKRAARDRRLEAEEAEEAAKRKRREKDELERARREEKDKARAHEGLLPVGWKAEGRKDDIEGIDDERDGWQGKAYEWYVNKEENLKTHDVPSAEELPPGWAAFRKANGIRIRTVNGWAWGKSKKTRYHMLRPGTTYYVNKNLHYATWHHPLSAEGEAEIAAGHAFSEYGHEQLQPRWQSRSFKRGDVVVFQNKDDERGVYDIDERGDANETADKEYVIDAVYPATETVGIRPQGGEDWKWQAVPMSKVQQKAGHACPQQHTCLCRKDWLLRVQESRRALWASLGGASLEHAETDYFGREQGKWIVEQLALIEDEEERIAEDKRIEEQLKEQETLDRAKDVLEQGKITSALMRKVGRMRAEKEAAKLEEADHREKV